MESANLRRRRGKQPRKSRQALTIFVVSTFALVVALAALIHLLDPRAISRSRSAVDVDLPGGEVTTVAAAYGRGLVFRHSVIPGGARDQHELQRAIESDPVVASHYDHVDSASMRPVTLAADRVAYVSYRLGDRVYWTKQPVRIRSGETILTNGQTEIRARCGNCISLAPLLPTSEDEPDPAELDALGDVQPLLVSWNLNALGFPPVSDAGGSLLPSTPQLAFSIGLPLGSSTPASGRGPGGDFPIDVPGAGGGPGSPISPPGPPPFGIGAPGGDVPFGAVGDLPAPTDALVLFPLLDDPGTPVGPPPPPPDLTAVPEPTTLWLLGTGLAGLMARRWRAGT